jgi:hypothetical protein
MSKHHGAQDMYDTELHCSKCGERLYLSASGVTTVRDSLKRTGLAGLMCVCGEVQFIGPDFKPIRPKPQKKLND